MNEIEALKESLDRQQQYSKRNCILIHGISEQRGEDTDEQVLKMIREKLGETVEKFDLDRTYRLEAFKEYKNKCRSIIVKFSWYNVRDKVFKNKDDQDKKDRHLYLSLCYMLAVIATLFP